MSPVRAPYLSFASRVACQPAEDTRWKFSESEWSASAGELPPIGPGLRKRIVKGALWQCGLLQHQSQSTLPCIVCLRHPKRSKARAVTQRR